MFCSFVLVAIASTLASPDTALCSSSAMVCLVRGSEFDLNLHDGTTNHEDPSGDCASSRPPFSTESEWHLCHYAKHRTRDSKSVWQFTPHASNSQIFNVISSLLRCVPSFSLAFTTCNRALCCHTYHRPDYTSTDKLIMFFGPMESSFDAFPLQRSPVWTHACGYSMASLGSTVDGADAQVLHTFTQWIQTVGYLPLWFPLRSVCKS